MTESTPARVCGAWRYRLLAFVRERGGEPFTARMVLSRFADADPRTIYVSLTRWVARGDLFVVRREPVGEKIVRWYAPVQRGRA